MRNWKKDEKCVSIGVLLFDDFSNHCLANAIEPLRAANTLSQKQLYRWDFLSLDGGSATSSSGLPVMPHSSLTRHNGADYLFVMPSYRVQQQDTGHCRRALRSAQSRFHTLVGLDMGSWLFASAGFLNGRKATIHWDELGSFSERFPDVDAMPDRIVHDGPILSCGGASSAFDLALQLVEAHSGPYLRLDVEALFTGGEFRQRTEPFRKGSVSGRDVFGLMRQNLEKPLSIHQIALQFSMTQRQLENMCNRQFHVTPRTLYRRVRLGEVRRLLQGTSFSILEIAQRAGYRDASAMSRAFLGEFGLSPSQFRKSGTFESLKPPPALAQDPPGP